MYENINCEFVQMGNSQDSITAHVITDAYHDIQLNCCQDVLRAIDDCHEENFEEKLSKNGGHKTSSPHKVHRLKKNLSLKQIL